MKRQLPRPSRPGIGCGPRRAASLYLLGFLLAVAAAPHHHLNSFEDLLSEGPSDSGIFIKAFPADPAGETRIQRACVVDDDPCLACFHDDYAASAAAPFVLDRTFTPLRDVLAPAGLAGPESASESLASRSPPDLTRFS